MSDFANRLRESRIKRHMTQKELGNILNVSQNAIFNWETGKTEPSIDTIIKMSGILGVSVDFLIGFEKEKSSHEKMIEKIIERIDSIGYTFRCDSDGNAWIEYPDEEIVYVSDNDLTELKNETDAYLRFRLEELRRKKRD